MPDVPQIKEKILKAVDNYITLVRFSATPTMGNIKPEKLERPPTSKEQALSHLLWLCDETRKAANREDFSTCRDHMNFINGALWYMGKKL